jgi:hypothetical protein
MANRAARCPADYPDCEARKPDSIPTSRSASSSVRTGVGRMFLKLANCRRQARTRLVTHEQSTTRGFFQSTNTCTDRGLCDMKVFSRGTEIPGGNDDEKGVCEFCIQNSI